MIVVLAPRLQESILMSTLPEIEHTPVRGDCRSSTGPRRSYAGRLHDLSIRR